MAETCNRTKKKPNKLEDMSKEQIREAILKKRECNTKAQKIVESLLEKGVNEQYLLQCLPEINQSHMDDVFEERSIIHLCGYPVCENSMNITEIPKQKYRISTKTNKVYDITARKNFCSNSCYQAAMHVKKQLLTSPLWFREYEEIPKFQLLPLDTIGSLGQVVDLAIVEKIKTTPVATSINDFAAASLNQMPTEDQNNDSQVDSNGSNKTEDKTDKEQLADELSRVKITPQSNEPSQNVAPTSAKTKPNPLNIVGDIIERPEVKVDPILTNAPEQLKSPTQTKTPRKVNKKQPSITLITIEVEKCLAEWFTLDSMLLLFGEEKVKVMVADKGECIKEYLNNYSKSIFYNANSYDQYQALCRKLNILELEDRRYDAQTMQRETKPLPDYSIIKEESKKMQLKVKAFFAGETDIQEPVTAEENTVENGEDTTQLPLVDKNAQNALRRRIVCQHLNKVLPDLLRSLGLLTLSISSDVRMLVNTFQLKPNNIMFKPIQWTLIAIIVIKLLSLRDPQLRQLLENQMAYDHMQLLLLSFKQDEGYLDRLISWLTDIDRLLDTNDTQLTVE